ncbi:MAG: DUF4422 domain-containing protein [Clostridia bacterium]|nr:DUF4422 domain-containing protein [Clostridia bacterium]
MTKILVLYHKDAPIVKSDLFEPIRIGAALSGSDADWAKDMPSDNTGDNISALNPTYNELTAIYWAWKHYAKLGDPEHIGIAHYRRFFIFENRKNAYYEQKAIDEKFFDTIKLGKFNEEVFIEHDFVAPMPNVRKSVFDNYCSAHHKDDIELALEIIKNSQPDMYEAAKKYVANKAAFFYNMFVLSRDDFFCYCDFVFGVLKEFTEKTEHPTERLFISEVLTGIFFFHLIAEGKKPLLLPVLFIGGKPSFKQCVAMMKNNFKDNTSGFLFKIKPLIVYFVPNFILLKRKHKTVSLEKVIDAAK